MSLLVTSKTCLILTRTKVCYHAPQTSLPFLIHLANPRQTDRSGLLLSNSDYSPCAAFVPKLPFPPRQLRADRHIRIIAVQLRLLPLRCFRTQTSLPFPIHLTNPRQTNTSGL